MDLSVSVTFSVLDQKADCKTVVYLKVLAQPVLTLRMLVSCVLVNDMQLMYNKRILLPVTDFYCYCSQFVHLVISD